MTDKQIQKLKAIKEMEKVLDGVYGDLMRLYPNETVERVYERLIELDGEVWMLHHLAISKYVYKRLWMEGRDRKNITKRFIY